MLILLPACINNNHTYYRRYEFPTLHLNVYKTSLTHSKYVHYIYIVSLFNNETINHQTVLIICVNYIELSNNDW